MSRIPDSSSDFRSPPLKQESRTDTPWRSDPNSKTPRKEDKDKKRGEEDPGEQKDGGQQDQQDSNDAADEKDEKQDEKPKGPPVYKKPLFWLIVIPIVLVLGIGGLLLWLHERHFENTDDAFIDAHYSSISPQVAAHVAQVLVDDNQYVKAGQVLVKLDPRDFDESLAQARAASASAAGKLEEARTQVKVGLAQQAQADADLKAAEATATQAARDLQRYNDVPEQAVSRQQVDAAKANARTSAAQADAAKQKVVAAAAQVEADKASVQSAEAELNRAKATVDNANLQLSYTTITAPYAGKVTNRHVWVGDYVQMGQPLISIVPTDVYVTANFKETQLSYMRPGQPVWIHVDAYPSEDFAGHVDSIQSGSGAAFSLLPAENATGNYVKVVQRIPVKIVFDKQVDKPLSPGMSVEPRVRVR